MNDVALYKYLYTCTQEVACDTRVCHSRVKDLIATSYAQVLFLLLIETAIEFKMYEYKLHFSGENCNGTEQYCLMELPHELVTIIQDNTNEQLSFMLSDAYFISN